MLRAVIVVAVALAAASSVWAQAQTPDRPHQAETSTRTKQDCCR